jgi:arylsulfatase A-like enzyme
MSWSASVRTPATRTAGMAAAAAALLLLVAARWEDVPRAGAVTDHVIIISIDGLRPDAIAAAGARTLQRLLREGARSLTAETVYPSRTLPSHVSMLTGLTPAQHGVTWNRDRTRELGRVGVPTIFDLARAQGFTTAAFFSKAKLRHLERPGSLDHSQAPVGLTVLPATELVEDATRWLRFRRPGLLFVHISEPDIAGHAFGWMGRTYLVAVRRADAAVRRLLEVADATLGRGGYTVIVTADHGGRGHGHGSDHPDDMRIPWIAWGAGVQPGELAGPIRTMDTAATALWLLGVAEPAVFSGVAVAAAYTPSARLRADAARPAP